MADAAAEGLVRDNSDTESASEESGIAGWIIGLRSRITTPRHGQSKHIDIPKGYRFAQVAILEDCTMIRFAIPKSGRAPSLANPKGDKLSVDDAKRRQAEGTINSAAKASEGIPKPFGGWIAALQAAIGMSTSQLAQRLGVNRNSLYKSIENEKAGSISLNQLAKIAEAMDAKLVYAIVPKDGAVKGVLMDQARRKAKRIIMRTHAHMALEEQTEGLRSQEEMIEELATQMVRDMARDFWS